MGNLVAAELGGGRGIQALPQLTPTMPIYVYVHGRVFAFAKK